MKWALKRRSKSQKLFEKSENLLMSFKSFLALREFAKGIKC